MSFADEIAAFAAKAKREMDQAHRKVAHEVFSRVITRTPVDTGRLRGNWQASIGSPVSVELDREDASGTATLADMRGVVLEVTPAAAYYLTNNLPYAARIEYGSHSQQAPQGMVRRTVAEFQDIVADAADGAAKLTFSVTDVSE